MPETIITRYGFIMGPAEVSRLCSDPKHGVWLMVYGKRQQIEIRVTKDGRLRVGKVQPRTFTHP